MSLSHHIVLFFFFNDTATTEIYTLSLHDALPISLAAWSLLGLALASSCAYVCWPSLFIVPSPTRLNSLRPVTRSEEHTSELQSQSNLVCRLLLEKKKTQSTTLYTPML